MPRAALSARQMDTVHIQGMLNVAFTRARDEIHVFHSAPIDTFTMAGELPGPSAPGSSTAPGSRARVRTAARPERARSTPQFEADVADALRARGVDVRHQYPACGFFIDLMCELDGVRWPSSATGSSTTSTSTGSCASRTSSARPSSSAPAGPCCASRTARGVLAPGREVERVLARLRELAALDDDLDEKFDEDGDYGMDPAPPGPWRPADAKKSVARVSAEAAAIMGALSEGIVMRRTSSGPLASSWGTSASGPRFASLSCTPPASWSRRIHRHRRWRVLLDRRGAQRRSPRRGEDIPARTVQQLPPPAFVLQLELQPAAAPAPVPPLLTRRCRELAETGYGRRV